MREVQASDAKTHLPSLLDAVERGETVVITRHGKAIARLVPEADIHQAQRDSAHAAILAFRTSMPRLSVEEMLSARHEGHQY